MILTHTAARSGKLHGFLRRELGLSYGLLKRLKFQHAYFVCDQPVHTDYIVKPGDVITVRIDEAAPAIPAEDAPLSILFEDEAVIALDKPAGLIVHPTFHRLTGTLAGRLAGYYQRTGQACAVHLVSRLDRDTAGVVLVAKNAHMHAILCGHMQGGRIEKRYHAAVYGHPAAEGTIDAPIARLSPTSLLRCVREDGKAARTVYVKLAQTESCALLSMTPVTGRTHQLRVHCAHKGFPMLGDLQYGTPESIAFSAAHGLEGQRLCAVSLTFPHPLSGTPITVHSAQTVTLP